MIWFLLVFALALGAVSSADEQEPRVPLLRGNCPLFWYSFNGRCYKYVASPMTWADAELHCVSQGANLVSIHSQEENTFVQVLIKNFDPAQGKTWFGLSDLHKEGRWMWSDGCAVKFVFWVAGEPNNLLGQEHCAHTNFGPKWNDIDCNTHTLPSVCATRIACP
ncbi:lactose-binding lectin l-2-like [Parambassis ranga]|uniref:Lactose-binding lectin l-2-like n=1 Tax=Parambassis ranga TaxID=210632 RepID=A0A6P7I087_9TELE|nr:lactose-binding lectin l-2-like [Parambassis ranga]